MRQAPSNIDFTTNVPSHELYTSSKLPLPDEFVHQWDTLEFSNEEHHETMSDSNSTELPSRPTSKQDPSPPDSVEQETIPTQTSRTGRTI